jgi:HAD superfamily hydrolase (TIGR01509 family)
MGAVAVGRVTRSSLDAVTIDAYGTLLTLLDPVEKLHALLPDHGHEAIRRAFEVEAAYYLEHSHEGRDEPSLARLHAQCTAVFNETLGSALTPAQYVGALEFEVLPGVREALARLRAHGLALAVVANWDFSLHAHLRRHGLHGWFEAVIVSGELGVRKPDPAPFAAALGRLGVDPARAVHVGDHAPDDEVGARAAGMRFEPAPLPAAVDRLL